MKEAVLSTKIPSFPAAAWRDTPADRLSSSAGARREMEAYYLGQGVSNLVLLYSPDKIIIGGGVMHQDNLFQMVRDEVKKNLNGYIHSDMVEGNLENYIVPPMLKDHAGLIGAIELGKRAWENENKQ